MKRAYIKSKTTGKKYYLSDLAKELGFDDEYCNKFNEAVELAPMPDMRPFYKAMTTQKPELHEELKFSSIQLEGGELMTDEKKQRILTGLAIDYRIAKMQYDSALFSFSDYPEKEEDLRKHSKEMARLEKEFNEVKNSNNE